MAVSELELLRRARGEVSRRRRKKRVCGGRDRRGGDAPPDELRAELLREVGRAPERALGGLAFVEGNDDRLHSRSTRSNRTTAPPPAQASARVSAVARFVVDCGVVLRLAAEEIEVGPEHELLA